MTNPPSDPSRPYPLDIVLGAPERVTVTPEEAAAILAASPSPIPLDPGQLTALADTIRAGRWIPDPRRPLLHNARTDAVVDGHLRYAAIAEAGVPVELYRGRIAMANEQADSGEPASTGAGRGDAYGGTPETLGFHRHLAFLEMETLPAPRRVVFQKSFYPPTRDPAAPPQTNDADAPVGNAITRTADGTIINGHHRAAALEAMGIDPFPYSVVVPDSNDTTNT